MVFARLMSKRTIISFRVFPPERASSLIVPGVTTARNFFSQTGPLLVAGFASFVLAITNRFTHNENEGANVVLGSVIRNARHWNRFTASMTTENVECKYQAYERHVWHRHRKSS